MSKEEDLDGVEAWVRGVVLAAVAMDGNESAWTRFDSELGEKCTQAWQALRRLGEESRDALFDAWKTEAAGALPTGIERLHPSWIEAVLAGEPAPVVRALCAALPAEIRGRLGDTAAVADLGVHPGEDGGAAHMAARRDLVRVAFAHLGHLCEGDPGPFAERLSRLELEELLSAVLRLGARALGRSLAGQAASVRARIMAAAGEPWAGVIAEASMEKVTRAEKKAAQVAAGAALPLSVRTTHDRLLHVGMLALKGELFAEHPNSPARIAGRLPEGLGRRLLE